MESSWSTSRLWLVAALLAGLAGIYFRFVALGDWPLARDEYFLYRSITFILEKGFPFFDCGGIYTRGLLMQYAGAPLISAGTPPELALRLIAASSSLFTVAAAALLGHRIGGMRAAAIMVVVLSLSAWQIEMARFGRMYAPFQAICMWHMYHAYRLVRTGDLRRWRWLFGLSAVGPLLWEGGIVLVLFNFVPIVMDRRNWRLIHLLTSSALLVVSYGYLTTNFRFLGNTPPEPVPAASAAPGYFDSVTLLPPQLSGLWTIALVALALVVIGLLTDSAIHKRARPLTLACIASASILLALNQLLLAGLLVIGFLLIGWLDTRTFGQRALRPLLLSLLALCAFWVAYAVAEFPSITPQGTLKEAFQILLAFPDIVGTLVWPWLRVMPIVAVVVVIGLVAATALALANRADAAVGIRLLLANVLLAATVISVAPTPFDLTRYSFFLYPAVLLMSVFALGEGRDLVPDRMRPGYGQTLLLLPLLLFLGNHFHFAHLVEIDEYEGNFRVGLSEDLQRHYYPRRDSRNAAQWVSARATDADAVVSTSVVVAHYLGRDSFIYLDENDVRYPDHACNSNTRDRWTGAPLLSTIREVEELADSADDGVWLVIERDTTESRVWDRRRARISEDRNYDLRHTTPDESFDVYYLAASSD